MHFRYGLETIATPDQALRALTTFGPGHLEIWKGSLSPDRYEVRELGDGWAVVKEGSPGPGIWVVVRYDWEPGRVRWKVLESGYCRRGTGDIEIFPGPGGGSRLAVEFAHYGPLGVGGAVTLLLQRILGQVLFPRMWKSALDRYAAQEQAAG